MSVRTSPRFWAYSLGAIGATAGFFGPIFLNPESSQGPLLGLLIAGPVGAVAGLVLGFLFGVLPFTDVLRTQALLLCCMLLGVGTLWYCLPEPKVVSRVVEGTIGRCRTATPGVVVELNVARTNTILEQRNPWNRGELAAQGWKRTGDFREYQGGGTCESYPRGKEVLLARTGEGSGLPVLEAIPERYRRLIAGT